MPNEQEAGAVIIALKAQIESLEKGFAKAKETLQSFGKDTEEAAKTTSRSGTQMATSFNEIDRNSIKLTARLAGMTQRLLGLQFVMQSVGNKLQGGALGKGMQVASDSLTTFAGIVSVFPSKAGLLVGAAAAIGVAIGNLLGPTEAYKKKLEELDQVIKQVDASSQEIAVQRRNALLTSELVGIIDKAQGRNPTDRRTILKEKQAELDREVANIVRLQEELRKLKNADVALKFLGKRQELEKQIEGATKAVEDLAKRIATFRKDADLEETAESWNKAMDSLDVRTRALEEMFEKGLIDPASRAEEEIRILEERVRSFFSLPEKLRNRFKIAGEVFEESLHSAKGEKETEDFQKSLEEFSRQSDLEFETARTKEKKEADEALERRAADFHERFTTPFSEAIGFAVADGIMSGAPAMETLANVGKNLFGNFLNDSIRNFQEGMTEAFKGIAGAGGAALGSVFTAVVGVAGALFANRKSKGSETFTGVRSQVESSQAVRGIVAGPSSVAIAAVGEDLARVMAPVVQRLDLIAKFALEISRNTRGDGGASGAGGAEFVGVPTA